MFSNNIIRNTQRAVRPAAARPLMARATPISGPRPQMAAFIAGQRRSFSATQPRNAMDLDNEAAEKLAKNLKKARDAERRNKKKPKTTPTTMDDVKLTLEDEEVDDNTPEPKEKSNPNGIDYSKIIDYYVSPNRKAFYGAINHLSVQRLDRLLHETSPSGQPVRVSSKKPLPPRTPPSSSPPPPPTPPPTPPPPTAPPIPEEIDLQKLDRDVHDLRDRLDQIECDRAIFETDREVFVRELRRLEGERERFRAALSELEGEMGDIKRRLGPFHWPWREGEMFRASWTGTKVVCFVAAGVVVVMWAEREISEGGESTPRLLGWKRI